MMSTMMSINTLGDFMAQSTANTMASRTTLGSGIMLPKSKSIEVNPEPSSEELAGAVKKVNLNLELRESRLQFKLNPDDGKPIVQVIDQDTQQVLRQIPSVEMMEIAKAIEKMQGVLMSTSA